MIDGVNRSGPPSTAPSAAPAVSRAKSGGDVAPVASAKPVAGPAETALGQVARDLAASPPVDAAKVDRLRMALADGSYKPDPDAIAAAMLALEAGTAKP